MVSAIEAVAGSNEAVSAAPLGKSSPAKSLLWRGFLRPVSSSSPEEEAVLALGSAESSSTREISSTWVFEKGKVATHHLSLEKNILRQGFLLQRSFGEVTKRRRLCSLEEQLPYSCSPAEQLPYSRSVKAPLGMDLDPVSPKADVVSPMDSAATSGFSSDANCFCCAGETLFFPSGFRGCSYIFCSC
jgi:hypothetical protein